MDAFKFVRKNNKTKIDWVLKEMLQEYSKKVEHKLQVDHIKEKIIDSSMQQIFTEKSGNFFFGSFLFIFDNVQSQMTLKEKQRFAKISIFDHGDFEEESYFTGQRVLREHLSTLFKIKKERKRRIYFKKLCVFVGSSKKWI